MKLYYEEMKKVQIKIENLRKDYGKQIILKNISFDIEEAEVCGLVGINGAGKSTLMKILIGIVQKSSGKVLVNGKNWSRDVLDKMGALIEMPAIYDNLSAFDNLKTKALVNNISNSRIIETLQMVGLENSTKKAQKFSMGMKMRLGIGLAILTAPQFLILDEPTNGLDPVGIKDIKKLILDLSNQGTTILVSSHQLKDIAEISQHIVMIDNGQITFNGVCESTERLEKEFFNTINR